MSKDFHIESREALLNHIRGGALFEETPGDLNRALMEFLSQEKIIAAHLWVITKDSYRDTVPEAALSAITESVRRSQVMTEAKKGWYVEAAQLILAILKYAEQITPSIEVDVIKHAFTSAGFFNRNEPIDSHLQAEYYAGGNWAETKGYQGQSDHHYRGDRSLQKLVQEGGRFTSEDFSNVLNMLAKEKLIKRTSGDIPVLISLPKPV